jgi:hypothetical protein
MAKTYEEAFNELTKTDDGKHKLTIVKNALLSNTLDNFEQLFAIIPKSTIQTLLRNSFYAFPKKIADPSGFTLGEIDFLAVLFGVDFDTMIRFFRKVQGRKRK